LEQTAKRRALDLLRREKSFHDKLPKIIATLARDNDLSEDPLQAGIARFSSLTASSLRRRWANASLNPPPQNRQPLVQK
jgi:hypothetical protein